MKKKLPSYVVDFGEKPWHGFSDADGEKSSDGVSIRLHLATQFIAAKIAAGAADKQAVVADALNFADELLLQYLGFNSEVK